MSSTAWVFAAGSFDAAWLAGELIDDSDLVIGVDGGIAHCLAMQRVPDVILGDFDSIDANVLNDARLASCLRYSYPARKDVTDLELALQYLCDKSIGRVVLTGVSGGRSDHHLFNWLLPLQQCWPFAIELLDKSVHAHVVTHRAGLQLATFEGQTISLLPLPWAAGVTTDGLDYPLQNASMSPGSTLGISNVATGRRITVSVTSGQLLVFKVQQPNHKEDLQKS